MPETPLAKNSDEVLAALDDLAGSIEANARDERLLARRIRQLREGRGRGHSWQDVLARQPPPGALELTSGILGRLGETSAALRRTLARALRAEGLTVAAIARRFGVTHQRVSRLLRDNRH